MYPDIVKDVRNFIIADSTLVSTFIGEPRIYYRNAERDAKYPFVIHDTYHHYSTKEDFAFATGIWNFRIYDFGNQASRCMTIAERIKGLLNRRMFFKLGSYRNLRFYLRSYQDISTKREDFNCIEVIFTFKFYDETLVNNYLSG